MQSWLKGCLAGTKNKEIFICTDQYIIMSLFYVANIERLKYVQKHSMKCKKVDKTENREMANLKRIHHMQVDKIQNREVVNLKRVVRFQVLMAVSMKLRVLDYTAVHPRRP
jgi:hypothetical protein